MQQAREVPGHPAGQGRTEDEAGCRASARCNASTQPSDPQRKASQKEYWRKYNATPQRKAWRKKYEATPQSKARRKEHNAAYYQKNKARIVVKKKEYHQKNKARLVAKQKEYNATPQGKTKRKEYRSSPHGKAKREAQALRTSVVRGVW